MAAFNNSPGGCCCDSQFWFDVYGFDLFTPPNYDRGGTCAPSATQSRSHVDTGWFIPPSTTISVGGIQIAPYEGNSEILWAIETTGTGNRATRYDAGLRNQLSTAAITFADTDCHFRVTPADGTVFTQFVMRIQGATAANATTFALVGVNVPTPINPTNTLTLVTGGAATTTANITPYKQLQVIVDPTATIVTHELPQSLAPRLWPRCAAAVETRWSIGQSYTTATTRTLTTQFVVCDLSTVTTGQGTDWQFGNPVVALDVTIQLTVPAFTVQGVTITQLPRWLNFDANSFGWIGAVYWNEPSIVGGSLQYTTHTALLINGQKIAEYSYPLQPNDDLAIHPVWQSPHASFSGNFALVERQFITPPSPSLPGGQLPPSDAAYKLCIYQGGSKIWSSPACNAAAVAHSSRDWIYAQFGTPGVNVAAMPGCLFSVGQRKDWLIKPDATASAPFGIRNANGDTPTEMQPPASLPKALVVNDTIKRTELLPDVPPAVAF